MTHSQKERLKDNLWKYFSIANFVILLSIAFRGGYKTASYDDAIQILMEHRSSTDEHMPFKDKVIYFMPRSEIEKDLEYMKEHIKEIQEGVKNINSKISSNIKISPGFYDKTNK